MTKLTKKTSKKSGLSPGTLIHIGEQKTEKMMISVVDYDEVKFLEMEAKNIQECFPFRDTPTVTWINIEGIHQLDIIERIGKHFDFHPLVLEDLLNTAQRPKFEDFEKYVFVVLKMLFYDERKTEISTEQISLLVGENFVISFQEKEGDVFNPVGERIRNAKGRHRKRGADYLAYSLIDAIVDNYFVILERVGERIEDLEDGLVKDPAPETLQEIHNLKRELIFVRKSVWPLREVISGLQRTDSSLIRESTGLYLGDVYDHTIQVIDTVESFRDMVSGMLDTYLSSISNRMNEVMKVLTLIATIFIPLTFIAGIYGMNFEYMPELHWKWAYPLIWVVILVIGFLMFLFFRRKKWI